MTATPELVFPVVFVDGRPQNSAGGHGFLGGPTGYVSVGLPLYREHATTSAWCAALTYVRELTDSTSMIARFASDYRAFGRTMTLDAFCAKYYSRLL